MKTEHPAEKLLEEIYSTLMDRLGRIQDDEGKEPHHRNAEADCKTTDAIDMIVRSIHAYRQSKTSDVAEPSNGRDQ